MRITPTPKLQEMLTNAGRPELVEGFDIDGDFYNGHFFEVARSHPEMDVDAVSDLTIYSAYFHPNAPHNQVSAPVPAETPTQPDTARPEYASHSVSHAGQFKFVPAPDLIPIQTQRPDHLGTLPQWLQVILLILILLTLCINGKAQTTTAPVTTASTSASSSTSFLSSAASTNATSVKASPGNVYSIRVINTTATLYYLRLYNLATAPTCSSATGFVETIPIPASATGAGLAITQYPQGYSTGIAYCLTGGGSSTDNTSAATGVYVTVLYK